MLDEGSVAIVPVDTTFDPKITNSYDIVSMRTGKIVGWYPQYIKVRVYNDKTGMQEDIDLPKNMVGIIENPLYSVINEPNSTMQRLVSKLNLYIRGRIRRNSLFDDIATGGRGFTRPVKTMLRNIASAKSSAVCPKAITLHPSLRTVS
jgi:hypothetical protein